MTELKGFPASRGIAMGPAKLVVRHQPDIVRRDIPEQQAEAEIQRFDEALAAVRNDLHSVTKQLPQDVPSEIREFLDAHLMMLEDATLIEPPKKMIREELVNAEWALQTHVADLTKVFDEMQDPYLRSRQEDVQQLVTRIQLRLFGGKHQLHHVIKTDEPPVIIADDLLPSDISILAEQGICGIVTAHSGPLSHTAIMARSLKIPCCVGVEEVLNTSNSGDMIIVDGSSGTVLINPDEKTQADYRKLQRQFIQHQRQLATMATKQALTRDGKSVELKANIDQPQDIQQALDAGATGVGLYRSEWLYMDRQSPPDEEEQFENYHDLIRQMHGLPVTIRTLDLGADKNFSGLHSNALNPALGLRGIRRCLRKPEWFEPQMRALLRASAYGPLQILIPMLTTVQEVFDVRAMIQRTRATLVEEGYPVAIHVPVGGMIEVPAAAMGVATFARYLDFLSIGTNDLLQYMLAVDRVDDQVSYLYDPLHPGVLRLLQFLLQTAGERNTPIAICGELAAEPAFTRLLLGLGLREFSMHPSAMLEIKSLITETNTKALKPGIKRIMRTTHPERLRERVEALNHV